MNLIDEAWIPVRHKTGERAVIAPWQMADATLDFPDWPRADLNIACLELLIGLLYLADPPRDVEDWQDRQAPDPGRLKARLAPFAPAFNLLGNGPRFMQDMEAFEQGVNDPNPPDMLFIDSAGGQTVNNNADLTVKRARYAAIDAPLAAVALYALQAHAPSGGAGNRTSMRGGGPQVTLVDPEAGLWPLVWANTPYGSPASADVLPWTRPAHTSEQGQQRYPHDAHPVEALFGMPRRLRLVAENDRIVGVVQRPYGTNYAGWEHPLTPHYRLKAGSELLPRHPRAGQFHYRNWLGITVQRKSGDDTARRATVIEQWNERSHVKVPALVAGWAMDNMKPRDFLFARAPIITLDDDALERVEALVEAADKFGAALRQALAPLLAEGETREAAREEFFTQTQGPFEARLSAIQAEGADWPEIAKGWVKELREVALNLFDAAALPGLGDRDLRDQQEIVSARSQLTAAFAGYGKLGREARLVLALPIPEQGRKKGKAA